MAYRTFHAGRYVFIRWNRPSLPDIDRLIAEVGAIRQSVKEPLIMFSVIPGSGDPPDSTFRKSIVERWSSVVPEGDCIHAVVEGSGVGASLNRAVLNTIRLFVRGRGIGKVYSTITATLRDEHVPVTLETLRGAGIVD